MSDTEFQASIKEMKNPYGTGNSAQQAYQIIKETNFQKMLLKTEDALEVKNG